jgi:hypothetical protein
MLFWHIWHIQGGAMPTIGDVMETHKRVNYGIKHFGATDAWKRRFDVLVTQVGKAIANDISYSKELLELSPNIQLGPLGELAYMNLCLFLKNNQTSAPKHLL